jgi:hypothetical protein
VRFSSTSLARATLAATLLALAAIGGACAWRLWQATDWLAARHPGLAEPFAAEGVTSLAVGVAAVVAVAAAVAAAGSGSCGQASGRVTRASRPGSGSSSGAWA